MRKVALLLALVFLSSLSFAKSIYLAPTSVGGDTGADCANAHAYTFFNSPANWGVGGTQIGLGDTVHACSGTYTVGAGASVLIAQGSGAAGTPITVVMDSGAVFQAPYFDGNPEVNCSSSCGGAIQILNKNYITVDGQNVGIIQNTDNGSIRGNQHSSVGVYAHGDHILIKRLIVKDIYVNCPQGIACADTGGFYSAGIRVDGPSTNVEVCGNTSTASHRGISTDTTGGTGGNGPTACTNTQAASGVNIHHNTVSDHGWQIIATGSGSPNIYSNDASDWSNWVYPTGGFYHLDGIITFGDTSQTIQTFIYNNYIHGDMTINGGFPTGFIFCSYGDVGSASACTIFNNVLQGTGSYATQGQGMYFHGGDGSHAMGPHKIYNNTFIGFATGQIYADSDTTITYDLRNNIYQGNGVQWFFQGNNSLVSKLTSNNDVFFNGRGSPYSWGSVNYNSLASWQAGCIGASGTGCDSASIVGDPLLNGSFVPAAASPAVGRGANLTSLGIPALNLDRVGVARPAVGSWDSGANQSSTSGISPSSVTYGNQTVGAVTINHTITFTNNSSAPLNISSIAATGDFSQINACPDILAGLDYCVINVTYLPSAVGAASGTLTVTASDAGSPYTVALSGTGVAPHAEYCISPIGADTNTGLAVAGVCSTAVSWSHAPGMPLCANNCAALTPQPGDIFDFRALFWPASSIGGTWNWSWSGTQGAPITLRTYPPDVATGLALLTGMYQVTGSPFISDANDPLEPLCVTPTCTLSYMNLAPASFKNFIRLTYNGDMRVRSSFTGANNCQVTNVPPMCVAGANLAAADIACGCPAGVAGQPSPYNHCAAVRAPCAGATPNQCFNFSLYRGTDINPSWHNLSMGDLDYDQIESWTQARLHIISAGAGQVNFSGTGAAFSTDTGCMGGLSGNRYVIENIRDKLSAGEWVLDRCPEQDDPGHCNGAQTTPSTINWRLYIAAAVGENPNTDTIFFPQLDPNNPRVFVANAVNFVNIQHVNIQGDNWQAGCPSLQAQDCTVLVNNFGTPDTQSQPLVTAAISFTDSSNIVLEALNEAHIQGLPLEFLTTTGGPGSSHNLIENGVKYNIGGGGIRIGATADNADTNNNVPSFITVQNEAIDYTQRLQMTGEATGGVFYGDAHDIQVIRNEIIGNYSGGIGCGHGLNRGATGGDFAYFMYNNLVAMNYIQGQNTPQGTVALMHDFGGIYCASNLSALAPTTGKPSLFPNTFSTHIKWNVLKDIASGWEDPFQGAVGIYLDQGASNVEIRFNLIARIAGRGFSFNAISAKNVGNAGAQLLEAFNLIQNNIIVACGARQYTFPVGCFNAMDRNVHQNQFSVQGNIFLINSTSHEYFQTNPGRWGPYNYSDATMVNAGSGYTSEPNTPVSGCTGASIFPAISYFSGTVLGLTIKNAGSGCVSPTVAITGGGGSGASATLCVSAGSLVSCPFQLITSTKMWDFGNTIGNQYFDLASNTLTFLLCQTSVCKPAPMTLYHAPPFGWGPTQEQDTLSVQQNPNFGNFTYPTDNFTPTNVPVGWNYWNTGLSGRQVATQAVPFITNPWPRHVINPNDDYLGGGNVAPAPQIFSGLSQNSGNSQGDQ